MSLSISRKLLWTVVLASLALPASAVAGDGSATGGAAAPEPPELDQAVCDDLVTWECARGARLTLEGASLDDVKVVRFLGGRGRDDDRLARPRAKSADSLEVLVPLAAKTGPIAVTNTGGFEYRTERRIRIKPRAAAVSGAATPLAAAAPVGVFPIKGRHSYGTETNRFGGGRHHGGQDVFAKCGTALVAVFDATVQHVAFQSRAGNYVVLQGMDGQSYAYMHMQQKAEVAEGESVLASEQVGRVGDTGHATGCHLHFELWTAPGWYEGGHAIDPLPLLRSLD